LFERLGAKVTKLFCLVDGNFPNHHPDPSKLANLEDIIQAVKDTNADMGFAFDGDGDRLGLIDNKGNVIWADRQMILYARDILSRNQIYAAMNHKFIQSSRNCIWVWWS
jgi:phosphomannomutase/phosphoglucomutase